MELREPHSATEVEAPVRAVVKGFSTSWRRRSLASKSFRKSARHLGSFSHSCGLAWLCLLQFRIAFGPDARRDRDVRNRTPGVPEVFGRPFGANDSFMVRYRIGERQAQAMGQVLRCFQDALNCSGLLMTKSFPVAALSRTGYRVGESESPDHRL